MDRKRNIVTVYRVFLFMFKLALYKVGLYVHENHVTFFLYFVDFVGFWFFHQGNTFIPTCDHEALQASVEQPQATD